MSRGLMNRLGVKESKADNARDESFSLTNLLNLVFKERYY